MTILFKEGILYKNEKIWRSAEKYYLSFAYGDWVPATVSASLVYKSEILDVRIELDEEDIYLGWNNESGKDEVIITKVFEPSKDLNFNRVFIIADGYQRAKYEVEFGMYNTIQILNSNSFVEEDRIEYNGSLYEITAVDTDLNAITAQQLNNAPYLPTSGRGYIRDASGYLLIASVLGTNYLFQKNEQVSVRLYGTTT